MKKISCLYLLMVSAFTASAQQIIPVQQQSQAIASVPLFSNNLSTAIIDVNQTLNDLNKDLYYYSRNYNKILDKSGLFNEDTQDRFADFYDAYNYNFSNNLINTTPMIRSMPPPGPNLDYYNVNTCGPGLYDKPVKQ